MALRNLVARGWFSSGGSALLLAAWVAGGCAVETNLAEMSGGAAGDAATAGVGNGRGNGQTGNGGSDAAGSDSGTGASAQGGTDRGSGGSGAGDAGGAPPQAGTGGTGGCEPPTIESYCANADCPSLDEAIEQAAMSGCNTLGPATIRQGCGFTTVTHMAGLSQRSYTFRTSDGEIVATSYTNDRPVNGCGGNTYSAGADIEACNSTTCDLCEHEGSEYLRCRPECTCSDSERPSGAAGAGGAEDACSDPESCDCYCSGLEQTRLD